MCPSKPQEPNGDLRGSLAALFREIYLDEWLTSQGGEAWTP